MGLFIVHKEYRNKGIGRKLINLLVEVGKEKELSEICKKFSNHSLDVIIEEIKERDEVKKLVRQFTDDEIEVMNNRVKSQVEDCVKFAEESPWPDDNELLKDVYIQEDYPFITD